MVQMGDWKLVWGKRFPAEARWELYDWASDPTESFDLASGQPERVVALAKEWEAWARRTGTPFAFEAAAKAKKGKQKSFDK